MTIFFKLKGAKIYQINDFNSKKTIQILKENNINYIFLFQADLFSKKKLLIYLKTKLSIFTHPFCLREELERLQIEF